MTELGLFDFDDDGHMRLNALYPDTSVEDVLMNTGSGQGSPVRSKLSLRRSADVAVEFIRRLDPLKVHEKEIRAEDMRRRSHSRLERKKSAREECHACSSRSIST